MTRLRLMPIIVLVGLLGLPLAWAGKGGDSGGNGHGDNGGHNNNGDSRQYNNGYMYYDNTPDPDVPGNDTSDDENNPPPCGNVYNCDDTKPATPPPTTEKPAEKPPVKETVKLPQTGGTVILTAKQTWTTLGLKLCKPTNGTGMFGESARKTYRSATEDARTLAQNDAAVLQEAAKADLEAKCAKECAKNNCKPLVLMGFGEGVAYLDVDCVAGSMVGKRMDEGACMVKTALSICYCVP